MFPQKNWIGRMNKFWGELRCAFACHDEVTESVDVFKSKTVHQQNHTIYCKRCKIILKTYGSTYCGPFEFEIKSNPLTHD